MLSIISQLHIFLWLLLTGFGLGLAYHLCSLLRCRFSRHLLLLDLLFLLFFTTLLLTSLYLIRWGEVRFFYLLGILFGFLLYRRLLRTWVNCFLFWVDSIKKE